MQQNISLFQIHKGLIKLLESEYYFTQDMHDLVVLFLGDTNWLDLDLKTQKELIESYLIMYLKDDYLDIISEQYSGLSSTYNKILMFKQDLIEIVQHLCWAQWLYLK